MDLAVPDLDAPSSTGPTTAPPHAVELMDQTLPFRSAETPNASAPPPTLTLQQYAALCAELAVFRDRTEATFHRYGLSNVCDRLAVDLLWQERLRRNPEENEGWKTLYRRSLAHFEQMKQHGGGR